jgi:hypothetical protein
MSVILIMLESSYFKVKQGVHKCRCIIGRLSHIYLLSYSAEIIGHKSNRCL